MPIRTSALRTLGGQGNVFAIESILDEIAAERGEDPIAFRLRHLRMSGPRTSSAPLPLAKWKPGEAARRRVWRALPATRTPAPIARVAEIESAEDIRVRN